TLSETPEGNLKWLAAISTAAHLIGRLPLKLTFSTESADSSRPAVSLFGQKRAVLRNIGLSKCHSV
ncbi:hypothetical protein, partial [Stutzerimonas stutzeri]|uniref:hypothetical protein n=1 Tax=Stutzerimonas stutzeri TaxID=316 RepID=UPI001F482A7A